MKHARSAAKVAIVLLSGGIDSATCVQIARGRGYRVRALTFIYKGIAKSELRAARRIAAALGVREHRFIRLPDLREAGEIRKPVFRSMPDVYIPARNSVFYSMATHYAEEVGASFIIGGHNKDDAARFPDATPAFFRNLHKALLIGSPILRKRGTRLLIPLSVRTKVDAVKLAHSLHVPLGLTWSCHRTGELHCWRCEGCLARIAAFGEAGILDPLRSRSRS